jgi:hypothetical protein
MSKSINNNIQNISKIMSLESKVNVVGSASIKRSIYYSDYDLFESVNNRTPDTIYSHFLGVFNLIKSSPNAVITDFKLGTSKNTRIAHDSGSAERFDKPLRWDLNEIHHKENNGVSFEEALKQKGIIKMDVVALVGSRFVEITEVYNIKIKGTSNMDYSKEKVIKDILEEYKEMVKDGNYMKSLKKMFSLVKLHDPNDKKLDVLMDYFNSPIGFLYRCKADLETILLILNYRKFDIIDIKNSLQVLKEQVSAFSVENNIEKISSLKSKEEMKEPLIKQIQKLKDFLNKDARKFIANRNL